MVNVDEYGLGMLYVRWSRMHERHCHAPLGIEYNIVCMYHIWLACGTVVARTGDWTVRRITHDVNLLITTTLNQAAQRDVLHFITDCLRTQP